MRNKILMLIISGAMLAAGCSKSKNNPSPSSDSYLPVTSGSTWTYNDVVNGSTSQLTVTMTGATTAFNSKTYYNGTSSSTAKGNSTGYFYAANHGYAIRATSAAAGLTIELQMGNDAQAVGYTWTTTPSDNGTVNGVPAQTVNTIKEKNVTKVVNGKTFTNVIHTQVDLQYNLGTGFQSVAIYDFYLAKGVGLIETDTSVSGSPYELQTITNYTIK
jgi:hypothetical protein